MCSSPARPCRFCRKWFRPHPRVGDRQRACSDPKCQAKRQSKQQAAWRERNPDYSVARRLLARSSSGDDGDPPRPPRPLDRLPWDIAQRSKRGAFTGVRVRIPPWTTMEGEPARCRRRLEPGGHHQVWGSRPPPSASPRVRRRSSGARIWKVTWRWSQTSFETSVRLHRRGVRVLRLPHGE